MRAPCIARATVLVVLVAAGTALLPAYHPLVVTGYLLTGLLLALKFVAGGRATMLGLSLAHLCAGVLAVTGPRGAVAFPVLLAAAVGLPRLLRGPWLAVGAAAAAAVTLALPDDGPWATGAAVAALVVVALVSRRGRGLQRWVLLAAAAAVADVVLTVSGAELIAAAAVLVALLAEVHGLYRQQAAHEAELRDRGARDPLTGALTRVAALAGAERLRHKKQTSVGLLDVDHFKSVNDTYGHAVGDEVLVEIPRRMAAAMRDRDLVGRFGGEEFVVILPDCDLDVAMAVAARVLDRLRDRPILTGAGALCVTASFGVAELAAGEDLAAALRRAGRALYTAKAAGRDRVGADIAGDVTLQACHLPLPDSLPRSNVTTQ